jgi:hypothetical protein
MRRPCPGAPVKGVNYRINLAVAERLDAFCNGSKGPRLIRAAIVELALVRLLDVCKDDPKNLFSK